MLQELSQVLVIFLVFINEPLQLISARDEAGSSSEYSVSEQPLMSKNNQIVIIYIYHNQFSLNLYQLNPQFSVEVAVSRVSI